MPVSTSCLRIAPSVELWLLDCCLCVDTYNWITRVYIYIDVHVHGILHVYTIIPCMYTVHVNLIHRDYMGGNAHTQSWGTSTTVQKDVCSPNSCIRHSLPLFYLLDSTTNLGNPSLNAYGSESSSSSVSWRTSFKPNSSTVNRDLPSWGEGRSAERTCSSSREQERWVKCWRWQSTLSYIIEDIVQVWFILQFGDVIFKTHLQTRIQVHMTTHWEPWGV